MVDNELHEGGCVCGSVRYRTKGSPKRVSLCACRWCQKRTGSDYGVTVYFEEKDVEILQGNLRTYRLKSDTDRGVESAFCEVCGTTVTFTMELREEWRAITGGAFDQPTFWYDPEVFIFTRTKSDWVEIPDELENHETAPYHPSATA